MSASIFGVAAPKFIDEDLNEILLDHVIITKDEPDDKKIIHESIFDRHREFIDKGNHWIFEVTMYLYKYTSREEKYQQLIQYLGKNVILYRRRDSSPFINAAKEDVYFRVDKIEPFHLETANYYDALVISFISVEPVTAVRIFPETMFRADVEYVVGSSGFSGASEFTECDCEYTVL